MGRHTRNAIAPKVKVCGLVRAEDATALNAAMPDYVGLVFYPKSKRFVSDDEAGELRAALKPEIATVGVFVDDSMEHVVSLFDAGTIQIAQLHGSESGAYVEKLRAAAPGLELWKAFAIGSPADIEQANASNADLVLLDNGMGTGKAFDWSLIGAIDRPFMLAGGLSCNTVADALQACSAHGAQLAGVDVSSGVEAEELGSDGRSSKDEEKVSKFVKLVRERTENV